MRKTTILMVVFALFAPLFLAPVESARADATAIFKDAKKPKPEPKPSPKPGPREGGADD